MSWLYLIVNYTWSWLFWLFRWFLVKNNASHFKCLSTMEYRNLGNFDVKNIHVIRLIFVGQGYPRKYLIFFLKTGLVHENPWRVTGIAIYLMHGPLFFPSDVAESADSYSAIPRIPFGWPTALLSKGTREDKGTFGLGRPSSALFSKYLNSGTLYNQLAIHVSSHVSYTRSYI